MALDDLLDDRKSYPRAAAKLITSVQALEDPEDGLMMLFGDTNAIVAHVKYGAMTGKSVVFSGLHGIEAQVDAIADFDPLFGFIVVLHRVGDQIAEHFTDPNPVPLDSGQRKWDAHFHAAFLQIDAQRIQYFFHNLVEVGRPDGEVKAADARELEQRIEQHVHTLVRRFIVSSLSTPSESTLSW